MTPPTLLVKPATQNESNLRTRVNNGFFYAGGTTNADLVVVSGYATGFEGQLTGSEEDDYTDVLYQIEMLVGPTWRKLTDVSPVVTPAGFKHLSSDTADNTGYGVTSCSWDRAEDPDGNMEKIRLTVEMFVRGGPDATVETLAYHLTAVGNLGPNTEELLK
jgi:hypothetical protein